MASRDDDDADGPDERPRPRRRIVVVSDLPELDGLFPFERAVIVPVALDVLEGAFGAIEETPAVKPRRRARARRPR